MLRAEFERCGAIGGTIEHMGMSRLVLSYEAAIAASDCCAIDCRPQGRQGVMSGTSYTLVSLPNEENPTDQVRIWL